MLAVLVYAPTLTYGFVWDDPISIQSWLPALPRLRDAFFPPPGIAQFPVDYYRPLQLLSYRLDRAIGGGAPWAFHLTVVLLHGLATALVFRSGARFLGRDSVAWWAALWAAALFAVHPIHSESVAWMAARPDVMVTCAGLAALLAYWRADWTVARRAAVAAAFVFVGLLCKENAAALLLIVPLSTLILGANVQTRSAGSSRSPSLSKKGGQGVSSSPSIPATTALPFVFALLAYLVLRTAGSYAAVPQTVMPSNPIGAVIGAVGTYLRLFVWPYPQNAYIADLPSGGAAFAMNALVIVAFVALLAWAWRRGDRPLAFALLWIAITLAPALAVVTKPATAPLAERYLYLPSVGFCWTFGLLVTRAAALGSYARRFAPFAAACILITAAGLTVRRNQVWVDNHSLWSDAAAKNQIDGLPLRSLAAATLEKGDPEAAERLFLAALERRNTSAGKSLIYTNLGTIALGRHDDDDAEQYYRQAAAQEPAPTLLYNLGYMRLRRGLDPASTADARAAAIAEARDFFERALAASPHDAETHVGLAQAAEAQGDQATARQHLHKALDLGLPATTAAAVRERLEGME